MKSLLDAHGIPFEFVTDGDPSLFNDELLTRFFPPACGLPTGGKSCTLNHFLAYERALKRGDDHALILENDPFFLGDFKRDLDGLWTEITEIEPGWILSLENTTLTFPSFWDVKRGQKLYAAGAGRMAGAYLIDRQGMQDALRYTREKKCDQIIDWWHNELIREGVLRMFWVHPALVEQGSHNGQMSSSISSKPRSLQRRFAWLLNRFYKCGVRRLFKQRRILRG